MICVKWVQAKQRSIPTKEFSNIITCISRMSPTVTQLFKNSYMSLEGGDSKESQHTLRIKPAKRFWVCYPTLYPTGSLDGFWEGKLTLEGQSIQKAHSQAVRTKKPQAIRPSAFYSRTGANYLALVMIESVHSTSWHQMAEIAMEWVD